MGWGFNAGPVSVYPPYLGSPLAHTTFPSELRPGRTRTCDLPGVDAQVGEEPTGSRSVLAEQSPQDMADVYQLVCLTLRLTDADSKGTFHVRRIG